MTSRRSLLKGLALGAGSLALQPFINHFNRLDADDADQKLPRRFVFVVKASGLQADFINPEGLNHGGDSIVDASLEGRQLAVSMSSLTPFREKLTILQGLSGKMCNFGHSSFYGALGAYKATRQGQPSSATVDGHLSNLLPSVFNHVGLKM